MVFCQSNQSRPRQTACKKQCLAYAWKHRCVRLPGWLSGIESTSQCRRHLIRRLGRKWQLHFLQYSCLRNPSDRGGWRAIVHGVAESDITQRLNNNNRYVNIIKGQKSLGKSFWHGGCDQAACIQTQHCILSCESSLTSLCLVTSTFYLADYICGLMFINLQIFFSVLFSLLFLGRQLQIWWIIIDSNSQIALIF